MNDKEAKSCFNHLMNDKDLDVDAPSNTSFSSGLDLSNKNKNLNGDKIKEIQKQLEILGFSQNDIEFLSLIHI